MPTYPTVMQDNPISKPVLSEQETFNLLVAFYQEAFKFLEVPIEQWAEIKMGMVIDPSGSLIHVDYSKAKIYIMFTVLRKLILSNPFSDNDSPTCYRMIGYKLARFWQQYLKTGVQKVFEMDKDSNDFSLALSLIKGVPMLPIDNEEIGSRNNYFDYLAAIKMLRDEFDIPCKICNAYDVANKCNKDYITIESDTHKHRLKELAELREECNNMPLPIIADGELGSEQNPFENVDDAANYILNLERERLANDPYRQYIGKEQYFYDGSFRISWASANVSYYPLEGANYPCFVVNQLDLRPGHLGEMPRFTIKPSLSRNKFLFRGQSSFYNPCRPNLFRDEVKNKKREFVDDIIQINELEVLLRQHPLVKLFEQGFYVCHEFIRFKINYIGLAQHYYNRTSLLDLTSDMDVAKFFAVTLFDMKNDCYRKNTESKVGVLYYYDLAADAFNERKGRHYHIDTIGKQPFMRSGNQAGFLINMNKDDNFNEFPEVRYVFFKHDDVITNRIFQDSQNGNKYMPQELLRTHWYNRMNDEKAMKEISIEALKLNFQNNPHMSHNKIRSALQKKGFHINSKNMQSSTESEFDSYYATSIQFWEEFCSNIYFYGPEGSLLKEHLRRLPEDPRYRWAFYKD